MPVAWSKFFPEVIPQVRGAPEPVVEDAVRNASIEFAARTTIARKGLTEFDLELDKKAYPLTPPAKTRVITTLYVSVDGRQIHPIAEDHLDHVAGNWREGGQVSDRYFLPDPHTLELTWKPGETVTNGIFVRVALKPTRDAVDLADELDLVYEDWHLAIAAGARANLFGMKGTAWYDPNEEASEGRAFSGFINQAYARATKSHTTRSRRARFRPFAGGSGRGF